MTVIRKDRLATAFGGAGTQPIHNVIWFIQRLSNNAYIDYRKLQTKKIIEESQGITQGFLEKEARVEGRRKASRKIGMELMKLYEINFEVK